ncbi:flagellar protein FlaG [Pokkaliibacter sp. MBI-7]|uniref:flagellar protein FlaG n=1 Tax=Pokkaliibacter sp. MBI-7 TaxID=3040600 RepID=UPI00244BEDCA|nr:flagellar protein FlaG [Pokkaliibacter sp. MBI-7]MDH2431312.1 flagellar protein FlaG [Pokkaliibacter sp. MBI-7]
MEIDTSKANAISYPSSISVQGSDFKGGVVADTAGSSVDKSADSGAAQQAEPASMSDLSKSVDDINSIIQGQNRSLSFSVDEANGKQPVISVIDTDTGNVIRQIPSEEVRKLATRIQELQHDLGQATGVMVDNKV